MKTFNIYLFPEARPISVKGVRYESILNGDLVVFGAESGENKEIVFTAAAGRWAAIKEMEAES